MPRSPRPDRVLFPRSGYRLSQAVAYYRAVAPVMLPHLKNRPLSFKRYPDTVLGESFWEKDAPSFTPPWVRRVAVARRSGEWDIEYIVVNDARTLTWVARVGGLEIHPFLHRTGNVERPTDVVFDLDPGPGASMVECCEVAVLLRDSLRAIGLESWAKVSGSKGLQLYVPLNTPATHEATETLARLTAEALAARHPRLVVAKMTRSIRTNRVFIDWSQNAGYKTTVAVYSLRATSDRPYVSLPVTWPEVEKADAGALYFEPEAALKRVARRGDLWRAMLAKKQTLPVRRTSPPPRQPAAAESDTHVVGGIRLPRPKSQSGRRLFVLSKTEMGDELWLDMRGKFKRWILRADREGQNRLIAMPAGDFRVDPAYFRGTVPAQWRDRVTLEDIGAYELIEGSDQRHHFDLFFTGRAVNGEWILERIAEGHRSWAFYPEQRAKSRKQE